MPMYEYECPKCGNTAETLGRVPDCCGQPMKRKPSVFSFAVKQIGKVTAHHNGKEIYST